MSKANSNAVTVSKAPKAFIADDSTRILLSASSVNSAKIAAQIEMVKQSKLPATVKAAALAGLESALSGKGKKPAAIVIMRYQHGTTKTALPDMIQIEGFGKDRFLMPQNAAGIIANSDAISKWLEKHFGADESHEDTSEE